MLTNPAGTAYATYMNNRVEARKKTASNTTAKPVTTNRAQEMFNQVRDQRKILNNGRT